MPFLDTAAGLGDAVLAGAFPEVAAAQTQTGFLRQRQAELAAKQDALAQANQAIALVSPELAGLLDAIGTPTAKMMAQAARERPIELFTALGGPEGFQKLLPHLSDEATRLSEQAEQAPIGDGQPFLDVGGSIVVQRPDGSLQRVGDATEISQYQLPGGTIVSSPTPGFYLEEGGRLSRIPKNARKLGVRQQVEEGAVGEFDQVKALPTDVADLQTMALATRAFMRRSLETEEILLEGGATVQGAPGVLSSLATSIRQQTNGFMQSLGIKGNADEVFGRVSSMRSDELNGLMNRLGVQAEVRNDFKSAVLELAMLAAAARGQTGKNLSDKDVSRFIDMMAGSTDIQSFRRVQARIRRQTIDDLEDRVRSTGMLGRLPVGFTDLVEGIRDDFPETAGDDRGPEIPPGLPGGTTFRGYDAEGKPVYRLPNGQEVSPQ